MKAKQLEEKTIKAEHVFDKEYITERWHCNNCNDEFYNRIGWRYKYCPNCGVKLEMEE